MIKRKCNVCDQPYHSKGYCRRHLRKFKIYGDPLAPDKKLGSIPIEHCSLNNCSNKFHAKGYCAKHYSQYLTYGDALHRQPTPEERYCSHYVRKGDDECWNWTHGVDKNGYGKIYVNGEHLRAHRFGWELLHKQSVPYGLLICHTCDNPPCQNPKHLFIGTNKDNTDDKMKKGRWSNGK